MATTIEEKKSGSALVAQLNQEPEDKLMLPQTQQPVGLPPGSTEGLSTLELKNEELQALQKPVDAETEVEIRPDGIIYMPAICVRQRLDAAVKPGRWAIRQERDPFYDEDTEECCYDGSLWIDGKFVSRAIGGCRWQPTNKKMTKSDAIEGAKSDCIRRCAKDIGIGRELWSPNWQREFIANHAEPYLGLRWDKRTNSQKKTTLWRKAGTRLRGDALASASALAGEFPLGFSPETLVSDGEYVGKQLKDVPDDHLLNISQKASVVEWKLAAKAEIVRRQKLTENGQEGETERLSEQLTAAAKEKEKADAKEKQPAASRPADSA